MRCHCFGLSGPEPFDRDDLVLTEELARRAALAVDNARLVESTRHLARTLQDSLLPRSIPAIPGTRITGRYRAAAPGPGGGRGLLRRVRDRLHALGLVIGDVGGKGPEAAAITSLARYTIRAVAGHDPARAVRLLNQAVIRDHGPRPERFLTVLFGIAGWQDGRFVIDMASAGHPPPLARRQDGRVETIAGAGPLIGIGPVAAYRSERVALEPGDSLLLYTDGLTDARAPEQIHTEADVARWLEDA